MVAVSPASQTQYIQTSRHLLFAMSELNTTVPATLLAAQLLGAAAGPICLELRALSREQIITNIAASGVCMHATPCPPSPQVPQPETDNITLINS